MIARGVGILGTGLWEGPPVGNDAFAWLGQPAGGDGVAVKDPFRGARDADGAVRVAGMVFRPGEDDRTLAALERSFTDPFRGARRRRIFPRDLRTSEAEIAAARAALTDARVPAEAIDAVLVQSFLPDEMHPKNAALVAAGLGIRRAACFEVDSICNSVVTQLSVACAQIAAGFARHVLCVQSVAYSRVSDPGASSTVQEGDGAGAFVVGPSEGGSIAFSFRTDGRLHGAIRLGWDVPTPRPGAPRRAYWEGSQERLLIRFEPELQPQVMGELRAYAREVCGEALARAELTVAELDLFVSHQPMAWYAAFMEDSLGLADGVSYDTFAEYGSINSVSLSASLHHARRARRVSPGSRVLLFGPAAGYTYAAAAVRWGAA